MPRRTPPAPAPFGNGGPLTPKDVRLIYRAVRERWPIPDRTLAALPDLLRAVLDDPATTARTILTVAHIDLMLVDPDRSGPTVSR